MKKILITGAGSYIGRSFEAYISQWPEQYQTDVVDMKGDLWKNMSFSGYDVLFHVAGIVHRRETEENERLYYEINRDLAAATAKKAKADGVGQFIFLSSMSVYGMLTGVITPATVPAPVTNYGKSKLQGENELGALRDGGFKVAIIRPPMVYGEGCRGNYQTLKKFAQKSPVFPDIKNRRSMISVENLCAGVKSLIDNGADGLSFPQDRQYVCTAELVRRLAAEANHKIIFTRLFNPLIRALPLKNLKKIFGDLIYENMEPEQGAENKQQG